MKTVIIQNKKNRQVRQGVLETNSSSTHSVTIRTKGTDGKEELLPLVEDGILYPKRLEQYTTSFGESSATVCRTKDEKAAILCNWIHNEIYELLQYEMEDATDEILEAWEVKWINYVKNALGYEGVEYDFAYFYPHGEYTDVGISFAEVYDEDNFEGTDEEIKHQLDKLIRVVLDDTKEIVDSDTAH